VGNNLLQIISQFTPKLKNNSMVTDAAITGLISNLFKSNPLCVHQLSWVPLIKVVQHRVEPGQIAFFLVCFNTHQFLLNQLPPLCLQGSLGYSLER
jgi:hypothetical protein